MAKRRSTSSPISSACATTCSSARGCSTLSGPPRAASSIGGKAGTPQRALISMAIRRCCVAPFRRECASFAQQRSRSSRMAVSIPLRHHRGQQPPHRLISSSRPSAPARPLVLIHCTFLRVSVLFYSLRPSWRFESVRPFCGATSTPRPGSTLSELASVSGVGGCALPPHPLHGLAARATTPPRRRGAPGGIFASHTNESHAHKIGAVSPLERGTRRGARLY